MALTEGQTLFALSALVMVSVVVILPPVALIPICFVLEVAASALMARGGVRDGDRRMVARPTAGVMVGMPLGLALTISVSVDVSRLMALYVILALTVLQFGRIRILGLDSAAGTYAAGAVSGLVTGLASVGGMVVALFVLAQYAPAAKMRATLAPYLVINLVVIAGWLFYFGMLSELAVTRGLLMAIPTMAGVFVGIKIFTPRYERFHRPVRLLLLMGLACLGLARSGFG